MLGKWEWWWQVSGVRDGCVGGEAGRGSVGELRKVEVVSKVPVASQTFITLSLEFCRTLKIIARILREVVNRVKLGDHYARRGSRGEVQSRVVVRRRGRSKECSISIM